MRSFGRIAVAALALATVWSGPIRGQQKIDPSTLSPSVVRIVVRGATATSASGFVWLTRNQVVTSLHAVPGGTITATCRGETIGATVSKVLPRADLALLTLSREFAQCRPLLEGLDAKPPARASLLTLGFHATASMTSRDLTKGFAEPETLDGLVSGAPLDALRKFGTPATDLEIYYVQGGLLPGYSGAPVFDQAGRLVGIADGGLNRGQADYNWVIPARYLKDLMASTLTTVPAIVAEQSALHFSAGIVDPATLDRPGAGAEASFVRTKTKSLAELARTMDDPAALASLLRVFQQRGTGKAFDLNRQFDIYQEANGGVLFAAPVNAKVTLENRVYGFDMPRGYGFVRITTYPDDEVEAADGSGDVPASDPSYFQEIIGDRLAYCESPMNAELLRDGCNLIDGTVRWVDFGNGNKILKFAYSDETDETPTLEYEIVAVRGNDAIYGTYTDIGDDDGDTDYLTGVFALNLITFPNLTVPGQNKGFVDTELDYDDSADDATTIAARYYEKDAWRFYHARGKLWYVPNGKIYTTVVERRRDANFVYLQGDTSWFAVPVNGGAYNISADQGRTWKRAGVVERR